MKIYLINTEGGLYLTADEKLARYTPFKDEIKAVIEWDVKTQGKNFSTWAKGKHIYKK